MHYFLVGKHKNRYVFFRFGIESNFLCKFYVKILIEAGKRRGKTYKPIEKAIIYSKGQSKKEVLRIEPLNQKDIDFLKI